MSADLRWDPVHDGRQAFRACLDAICAPGQAVAAPAAAGLDADEARDRAAAVLLSLMDVGTSFAVSGDAGARALGQRIAHESGASPAPVCDADFVLVTTGSAGCAGEARRGSALLPHEGATLIYAGTWPVNSVELEGPGLPRRARFDVGLPPGEIGRLRDAAADAPAGVDAFVVTPDSLVAIPRSVIRPRMERG